MKTQTIKLLTPVIINGQQASPKDKNNGIYAVTLPEARNLIARKRAVKFDGKIEDTDSDKTPLDLAALKAIADELGVKYNQNIEAKKLEEKINPVLDQKAEEIGLTFAENTPLDIAYNQYKEAVNKDNAGDGDKNDDITAEELAQIAKDAEIDVEDGEDLKETVEAALKEYAQNLNIEVSEDDNAKTLWAKVQKQLEESK